MRDRLLQGEAGEEVNEVLGNKDAVRKLKPSREEGGGSQGDDLSGDAS